MPAGGERLRPPFGELRVRDDVSSAFATFVSELASRADTFRIALSGGETARACYQSLARCPSVAWERIECFLGDERCVPPGDVDANERLVREALIDHVPVRAFHPMDCEHPDDYEETVATAEPFDLVHLGLGPDGHTASLFPDSDALDTPPGRLVVLTSDPHGRNPHRRMSLTFEAISRSRRAVFTVAGAAKHDALHRVLVGEDLPAARVRAGEVIWLCDPEALGGDLGRVG